MQTKTEPSNNSEETESDDQSQSVRIVASNKQGLAGFVAGATSSLLTHPLDLIKTRYQSSYYSHYNSMWRAAREIGRAEGWRALYNGWSPALIGVSAAWSSYFWLYARVKSAIRQNDGRYAMLNSTYSEHTSANGSAESSERKLLTYEHFLASFSAGIAVHVLTNPIFVVKTNCILNRDGSLLHNANKVWRLHGLRGFYRGVLPSAFGTFQNAIMFTIYEQSKYLIQEKQQRFMNPAETLLNTMVAKSIATMVTYPHQIVRTRLRHVVAGSAQKRQTVSSIVASIYASSGLLGFYRGMAVNLTRIMPSTCIMFLVFESLKPLL